MKEDPNPLATAHPQARKVCQFFRSGVRVCRRCLFFAILGLLACLLAAIPLWKSGLAGVTEVVAAGCLGFACVSAALCVVFYVLRLAVILMFFVRYSLGQLMGAVLWYGACMTLIVKLPSPWKLLPIMALGFLVFVIWIYIVAHDPEAPWFTPAFVRRVYGPKKIDKDEEEQEKEKPADEEKIKGGITDETRQG